MIGGYVIGWLADRIGRRKALILSSVLAGVFIWPFGYMTNYPALVALSLVDTLGFAGYLAINVMYMGEMLGPAVRGKVIRVAQVLAIFLLATVLNGLIPHYWIPSEYRLYLWLLAGLNILVALALLWRMPESPRWLEPRQRRSQARTIVERMEARTMKRHPVLPGPDLTPHQVVAEEKANWLAPFGRQYVAVTVFLLVVMVLGYGHVYGYAGYRFLFLAESRHYSASLIFALAAWAAAPPLPSTCSTRSSANGPSLNTPSSRGPSCSPVAGGASTPPTTPRPWSPSLSWRRSAPHCGSSACGCTYPATTRPGCARWAPAGPTAWPPRRLGRHPAQRSGLQRSRATGLDLADHDTGRAPPPPSWSRSTGNASTPHPRRTGPVDTGPPGPVSRRLRGVSTHER